MEKGVYLRACGLEASEGDLGTVEGTRSLEKNPNLTAELP
jgi:hypothetical protein